MQITKNTAVFVIGMHRSGTSAVSGALRFAGLYHGDNLMVPADDNPKGFWESRGVANLNERILAALGAQWDNFPSWCGPTGFTPEDPITWARSTFDRDIDRVWEKEFSAIDGPVVLKDPRMCLTYPLWAEAAKRGGRDVEQIFVVREPQDVAASLWRRNRMQHEQAQTLWARYNLAALSTLPPGTPIIRFDDFIADPVSSLRAAGVPVSGPAEAELRAFATRPANTHHEDYMVRPRHQNILVRNIISAIGDQPALGPLSARSAITGRINHLLRASDETTGNTFRLGPPARPQVRAVKARRPIVFHCHIFKNAGTSVDHILKTAFGDQWNEQEFPGGDSESNADLVLSHMVANSKFTVFSSHTGNWFFGHNDKPLTVLPIYFLRHPILRTLSAYQFEKKQAAFTAGAELAKQQDFAGYVRTRLETPLDYALRNFQARRLACLVARTVTDVRSQALDAFERLPFIGRVEDFAQSSERMEAYLKPYFPEFQAFTTQKNVTSGEVDDIDARLEKIRQELGDDLMDRLIGANQIDLLLYDKLAQRYAAPAA